MPSSVLQMSATSTNFYSDSEARSLWWREQMGRNPHSLQFYALGPLTNDIQGSQVMRVAERAGVTECVKPFAPSAAPPYFIKKIRNKLYCLRGKIGESLKRQAACWTKLGGSKNCFFYCFQNTLQYATKEGAGYLFPWIKRRK